MDTKKILGQRIKELRKQRHISQEQLAELVQLEPPSICNIENGKNYPTLQNLEKIINVLNVSFVEMFNFAHHQTNENLKEEINQMLNKNPDRIKDIYKIIKALVE